MHRYHKIEEALYLILYCTYRLTLKKLLIPFKKKKIKTQEQHSSKGLNKDLRTIGPQKWQNGVLKTP